MARSISKLVLFLLALMSPFATGCSDGPPAQQEESTGVFSAALVTQGADGATYQFPTGTFINLRIQDNTFNDFFALDNPNEALVSRRVPAGSYTAVLTYNGAEGAYLLQRTQNGQVSVIPATLLNPAPITFDVTSGGTTSLALSFRVQGLSDITFSVGNVNITLNTSEQVNATGTQWRMTESGVLQNASLDPSLSMQAQTLLAVSPGEMFSFSIFFNLTGSWFLAEPGVICAFGTITSMAPNGSSGYQARMSQILGASGRACVLDSGGNDQVYIRASKSTTPPDQAAALPGSYSFDFFADGYGGEVFNGTTFQQSLFEGPRPHGFGTLSHTITDLSTNTVVASMGSVSSLSPTIQIVP